VRHSSFSAPQNSFHSDCPDSDGADVCIVVCGTCVPQSNAQATSEATVQHILLDTEPAALELRRTIEKDKKGLSVESFGEYAREHSTCGSSKKTPDAKMSQLRGNPGEMKFLRATVDKAFGDAAFSSEVGKLCGPIKSQYGEANTPIARAGMHPTNNRLSSVHAWMGVLAPSLRHGHAHAISFCPVL
jgi:hypothetical protein